MSLTPTNHWKLGLFVSTGLAIGVFALFWFGLRRLERESITVYTYFTNEVDGLSEGSPVKYQGVPIGEVTGISVAETRGFIKVRSEIYLDALRGLQLTNPFEGKVPSEDPFIDEKLQDLRVQLRTQLLTGQSYIQTVRKPEVKGEWPPEDKREWATLPSIPSEIKSLQDSVESVLTTLPETLRDASELFKTTDKAMQELDVKGLSREARELMATVRRRIETLEEMRLIAEATRTMQSAGELVDELRDPAGPLSSALDEIRTTGVKIRGELANADLEGLSRSLQGMGGSVDGAAVDLSDLIARLRGTIVGLDATLLRVRELVALLERDPGSLLHGRSPAQDPLRK